MGFFSLESFTFQVCPCLNGMYHRRAVLKRLFKLCSILGLSEPTTFGTFSGKDVPSQIASNGHIMRLEFQSDHSNTGKGFNISYTSMYKLPSLCIYRHIAHSFSSAECTCECWITSNRNQTESCVLNDLKTAFLVVTLIGASVFFWGIGVFSLFLQLSSQMSAWHWIWNISRAASVEFW